MSTDPVRGEAERIARLPGEQGRRVLSATLSRAADEVPGSPAHNAALTFNALLCTALRELCEARKIPSPWSGERKGFPST